MPPTEAVARAAVCLPVEQWPEADAQAWLIALEPPVDPFSECSAASSWSEPSRVKTAKGYGRWLHWVSETGLGLDERPADRVTPQKARAYVTDLRRLNSDSTVLCRIQELYDAIRVIAPDRDWAWLRRGQNRLRARCEPVRDKMGRIQPADVLVELGKTLMTEAATSKSALRRAVLYRDGLIIAFLAFRFVRLSNLAMITLGLHLVRHTDGYRLCFSGPEMKGGRPFEAMVPAALVVAFDRYIDHHRPIPADPRRSSASRSDRPSLDLRDRDRFEADLDAAADQEAHPLRLRKAYLAASVPGLRRDHGRHRGAGTCRHRSEHPQPFDADRVREALQSGERCGGEPPVSASPRRPARKL